MKYRDDLKTVSPYVDKIDELYKFQCDFFTPLHKKFKTWGIGKQFVFCLFLSLFILLLLNILKTGDIFSLFMILFFVVAYNYGMSKCGEGVSDKSNYNIVDVSVVDKIHEVKVRYSPERDSSSYSTSTRKVDVYFVVLDGLEEKIQVSRDIFYTLTTGHSYRILLYKDKIEEIFEEISEEISE